MDKLRVIRASPYIRFPKRATDGSAGFDICSDEDDFIDPMSHKLFSTGLKLEIPDGFFGRIVPRSGLTLKHFIDVGTGIIDSDYCDEEGVVLFYFGNTIFEVEAGERIAQIIFLKYEKPAIFEVSEPIQMIGDKRNGGFGSTGTN